ncbi:hypothetical protein GGX14DRAFT_568157 [Mycena pura]|uniref:Uncharacterized protein n=1 Tax=Mycena pura TaxID=153505 RepID=A0AAD6V9Y3_9AGAR|nr:hypothetical protein GGX14DRAFT_568157 [Mycena pura]
MHPQAWSSAPSRGGCEVSWCAAGAGPLRGAACGGRKVSPGAAPQASSSASTPNTSTPNQGVGLSALQMDKKSRDYSLEWNTWEDFECWREEQQRAYAIELQRRLRRSRLQTHSVCLQTARENLKTYDGATTVLGNYNDNHNHALGNENLKYTHIPPPTLEYIASCLRRGISPDDVRHDLQKHTNLTVHPSDITTCHREDFITLRDIRRIANSIKSEKWQLDFDDGRSIRL